MRILIFLLLVCLTPWTLVAAAQKPARRDAATDAAAGVYAVLDEVDRIAARQTLWPNFDPRRVPVEIYDGQTTLLFRHPAPPPEFISLSSRQGVWAFPGRHETVTGNAPAKLNNVLTATVLLKPDSRLSLTARAALVIHEAFHVHQIERHPNWRGNELELFVYPFEDAELLALRRVETETLRRADAARDAKAAACWARLALNARRARFARLSKGAQAYERASELNEGLARYVEARAARKRTANLPAADYAAEDLRTRVYATGHALALLLERFAPRWSTRLEAGENLSLDELLAAALSQDSASTKNASSPVSSCALPQSFAETARTRAKVDVAGLSARRTRMRREFEGQDGWKIVVTAGTGAPLWPQGFDPLNVLRVGSSDVLHTRFLKLGNAAGAIEILDQRALTEGASAEHPLFNGVRQLTLAGLAAEPLAVESAGKTTITAAHIKGEFRGARLERAGRTLSIILPPQSN
ncbi:MAG TPA: hypothetical protein VGO96_19870 [Pyrinomonadaceae bacterium]|jgi:hypothetical protein|nr:hypothetical protein [Pyrinomonadaceae bacterium]